MPAASNIVDNLQKQLFSVPGNLFAVVDGAALSDLLDALYRLKPPFYCLYRGELQPDIAEVAPYLVQLEEGSGFTSWLLQKGLDKHFGIFLATLVNLLDTRRHLRRLLTVHTEDGKPLLFRFYDPRVLPTFLSTCTQEELTKMFGPIESYLVPSNLELLCYKLAPIEGKLSKTSLPL
jgi:Domain of unknown function (DUF4123)